MRIVGSAFHSEQGKSYIAAGSVTVAGLRQRFLLFRNERKRAGSDDPDFYLKSWEGPGRDRALVGTPSDSAEGA